MSLQLSNEMLKHHEAVVSFFLDHLMLEHFERTDFSFFWCADTNSYFFNSSAPSEVLEAILFIIKGGGVWIKDEISRMVKLGSSP